LLPRRATPMTTVEPYRSAQLEIPSDVPSTLRRPHSPPSAIARSSSIPPAVPSPPRQSAWSSPPRRRDVPTVHEPSIIMDSEGPSQWLFTDAEINCTPSTLDKLPIVEERCRRAKGVNFIIQAGILLKLPQLTLATASVFFHRFYMRSSMVPERGGLHHYVWYPIPP
jgi:protein BUR2